MLRHLKTLSGVLLAMTVVQEVSAHGPPFTIFGPLEPFQAGAPGMAISYQTRFWYSPTVNLSNQPPIVPGNGTYTEIGGPKNFGAGSRLNVPMITYGYDYTFLNYFGAAGVKAVDAAFAVLNQLPPVSSASAGLTEFIQQGNQQVNYTARALNMLDLKSTMLQILIEHMGLLGETHVYDILEQDLFAAPCSSEYFVGIRNFDPITWNPSTYVNGTSYDFQIIDGCPAGTAIADAMEQANGVTGAGLSFDTAAVATAEALRLGGYYLGITRDDFGGLRYLYRKNNYNVESMPDAHTYVGMSLSSAFNPVGATNVLDAAWTGTVGGVEKITYVKVPYDSTVGNTFPTNGVVNVVHYSLPILTNFAASQISVYRTNTQPDIIITAANLLNPVPVPDAIGEDQPFIRVFTFIAPPAALLNHQAGTIYSEVISPTNLITFNNVGGVGLFENPNSLQQSSAFANPYFQFGSFDGTTNPPIAFPTGISLTGLIQLELQAPSGAALNSPFNAIMNTNTTAGGGTGAGAVGGAGGGGGGAAGASARLNGAKSP